MSKKIVLATGNKGKVKEFATLFENMRVEVVPQSEFQVSDADETGTTFVENAIIKARHAASVTGMPTIADDSGLAVDALGGAPGIYSSRYSGDGATDASNIDKLLDALKDTPDEKRTARFICVLVFMRHADDPTPIICQGAWEGEITRTRAGEGGFGYDPVFFVPSLNKTAADLEKTEKNAISHRGQALKALMSQLEPLLA